MELIFDITKAFDAMISLEKWLNINGEDTLMYIIRNNERVSSEHFIETFEILDETVLKGRLSLVSLHVTTNNDKCASIKQYGLRSLKDAIRFNTPISRYFKEKGVVFDIENGEVEYKGNVYDIGSWKKGYSLTPIEEASNYVYRKLYEDQQVNGFLCFNNVLNYGGGVNERPEFLHNLSVMLRDRHIEEDWKKTNKKCYVLKYKAEISKFYYFTFVDNYIFEEYEEEPEELELIYRRWLIGRALAVIQSDMFNHSMPESFTYLKSDEIIPPEDIIKIYSDKKYLEEYKMKDRW